MQVSEAVRFYKLPTRQELDSGIFSDNLAILSYDSNCNCLLETSYRPIDL